MFVFLTHAPFQFMLCISIPSVISPLFYSFDCYICVSWSILIRVLTSSPNNPNITSTQNWKSWPQV